MIHAEYSIICDGCGRGDLGSERSPGDAWRRASAEGWTATPDQLALTAKHWCPACTEARKETR